MNLQALAHEASTSTASADPNFNNMTFEEKFNNGWLKNYFYGVIACAVVNVGSAINNLRLGIFYLGNPIPKVITNDDGTITTGTYGTMLYGLSLIILAAAASLFTFGLFLQFQAIKTRSLEKQYACVKVITFFVLAQAVAAGFNIFSAVITGPVSMFTAIVSGVVFLAVGVAFRFLAANVKNIMLGKAEESFKFDKSDYLV